MQTRISTPSAPGAAGSTGAAQGGLRPCWVIPVWVIPVFRGLALVGLGVAVGSPATVWRYCLEQNELPPGCSRQTSVNGRGQLLVNLDGIGEH